MLKHALAYSARGRPAFPCRSTDSGAYKAKSPLTKRGFLDATTDEAQIRAWWERWPDALIGVPTGETTGVVVLDVDTVGAHGKDGEASLLGLQIKNDDLPETLTARTWSGGRHLYFEWPGQKVKTVPGKVGDGLDVKGDGGYVIVPPSQCFGGTYEWTVQAKPAPLPPWLREIFCNDRKEEPKPKANGDNRISEGGRNDHLTRQAGAMRYRNMSEEAMTAALMVENTEKCEPPPTEGEVCHIAHSVARYGSSRQGCESRRVQVPLPSVTR